MLRNVKLLLISNKNLDRLFGMEALVLKSCSPISVKNEATRVNNSC